MIVDAQGRDSIIHAIEAELAESWWLISVDGNRWYIGKHDYTSGEDALKPVYSYAVGHDRKTGFVHSIHPVLALAGDLELPIPSNALRIPCSDFVPGELRRTAESLMDARSQQMHLRQKASGFVRAAQLDHETISRARQSVAKPILIRGAKDEIPTDDAQVASPGGWQGILGWSDDIIPFYEQIAPRIPHGGTFVEVGVFMGRSFARMGQLRPDLQLWAVDPWKDEPSQGYDGAAEYAPIVRKYGGLFRAFMKMMSENVPDVFDRMHIVRARSTEIVIGDNVDFVFLDGAHDYESVRDDIAHWHRNVKVGGILAGHDFSDQFPGVKKAVSEFGTPTLSGTCWWIEL